MRKFMTYLRINTLLSLRDMNILIFGMAMPVGIAALIASIGGNSATSEGYTYLQGTFGSLITVGICATAFMGIPLTISGYRDKKILKQFFVTPTHPGFILCVQAIIMAIMSIISAVLIFILLYLFFGYRMEGNVLMFLFSFVLSMISMYGIGMLLASLCKDVKTANLVTTFVYFPMLFLSGATVPFEMFPTWLQSIASYLPLSQCIQLLKGYSIYQNPEGAMLSMIILIVIAVITILLSIILFKWD